MAKKLDWFPLHVPDLLTSRKMLAMLPEERGWYVLLLAHEWDGGPLPLDMAEIGALLGIDGNRMATAWQRIGRAFTETPEGYINDRLEATREEQNGRLEARSRAGAAGAEALWAQRKNGNRIAAAKATARQGQCGRNARREEKRGEEKKGGSVPDGTGAERPTHTDLTEAQALTNRVIELGMGGIRPPDYAKQAARAAKLLEKGALEYWMDCCEAMGSLFPYSKAAPWDVFNLGRDAAKALAARANGGDKQPAVDPMSSDEAYAAWANGRME